MICHNCGIETGTQADHPFERPTAGSCEVARLRARIADLSEAAKLTCLMFERKNLSDAELDWMGDDEHEAWTALRKALAKAKVAK